MEHEDEVLFERWSVLRARTREDQREVAERVRVERQIGARYDALPKSKGGRPEKNPAARRAVSPTVTQWAKRYDVKPSTIREWRHLARTTDAAFDAELQRRLDTGTEISTRRMVEWARRHLAPTHVPVEVEAPSSLTLEIMEGDSLDGALDHLADRSVDAFITDPPYGTVLGRDGWARLGKSAARLLCPGHPFASFTGGFVLPDVLDALGAHLQYRDLMHHETAGRAAKIWDTRVNVQCEPIVVFTTIGTKPSEMCWISSNLVRSPGSAAELHQWQKSLESMLILVERLTKPGDLVVDPFAGSGTTGVACLELGRGFIGVEIDPHHVYTARRRLGLPVEFDWDDDGR